MPHGYHWEIVIMIAIHTNKNVEPVLSLAPLVKAFALPCSSKRATPKAPRVM